MRLPETANSCRNMSFGAVLFPEWDKYGTFTIAKKWEVKFSEYIIYLSQKENQSITPNERAFLLWAGFFPTKQCKPSEVFALWKMLISLFANQDLWETDIAVAGIVAYFKAIAILHGESNDMTKKQEKDLIDEAWGSEESRRLFIAKYREYIANNWNNAVRDISECVTAIEGNQEVMQEKLRRFFESLDTPAPTIG